jgi:hypothetical protein
MVAQPQQAQIILFGRKLTIFHTLRIQCNSQQNHEEMKYETEFSIKYFFGF